MARKVRPIRPDEIAKEIKRVFPDAALKSFNELIARKWTGNSATILQDEVVASMVEKGLNRKEIFEKGWLNVEDAYRSEGWRVEYNKPAYNETYALTFKFSRRSSRD